MEKKKSLLILRLIQKFQKFSLAKNLMMQKCPIYGDFQILSSRGWLIQLVAKFDIQIYIQKVSEILR